MFAGGLLTALVTGRRDTGDGIELGMRLARHKMRHSGAAGHADFPRLHRSS